MADLGKVLPIPKGIFDLSATYEYLDIVRDGTATFVCKVQETFGVPTSDEDTWQMLCRDGSGGGSVDIDGITITQNAAGEIQVATPITDKLSVLDVTGKDADLFLSTDGADGLKWVEAPNGTKRYMLGTIPVGDNVLGVWQEGEESTWNTADFVWDEGLYEDATKNEVISLNFYYDTKTNQPIYLAGYQWWNNETLKKGGLVVVVANEIESPVDIWVEVMRTVEV